MLIKTSYKGRGRPAVLTTAATLFFSAIFITGVGIGVGGVARAQAQNQNIGRVVDRVVAVVNDDIITLSELESASDSANAQGEDNAGLKTTPPELMSRVIDNLIERLLMKQAADSAGIEVSEAEIDNAIADVTETNNLTREQLLFALAESGLGYVQYRDQLREDIRQAKFIRMAFRSRINIPDEDAQEYYTQNIRDFQSPPTIRLRVISLAEEIPGNTGNIGTPKAGLGKRLAVVMEELGEGVEFAEVAATYSDGGTAAKGGDLGYLKPEELDPAIRAMLGRLSPGEVSPPVRTRGGTNIFQLVERREGSPRPLKEVIDVVRDRLYKELVAENYELWLEETRKVSHIEVRL